MAVSQVLRTTRSGLVFLNILCILALPAAYAAPQFDVHGRQVTVTTERYRVVVDGLAVVQIENRLTGEVYARSGAEPPSASMRQMLGNQGVLVETLPPQAPSRPQTGPDDGVLPTGYQAPRPKVPDRRYGLGGKTQVSSTIEDHRVVMRYVGLQHGSGEQALFEDKMTVELAIAVDAATGDLVLTPNVIGNLGARDRGVRRVSLHVMNLAPEMKIILPVGEGHAYTAAPDSDWLTNSTAGWSWPMHWEAGLAIAETAKGCLGVWADEPALDYGRHVALGRSHGRWNLGFEYETTDAIDRCDAIERASWRINVFEGYWMNAAERYVQQMKAQWKMMPLDQRTPAWASRVRVVLPGMPSAQAVEQYAKLLPPDALAVMTTMGWAAGYGGGGGFTGGCVTKGWWPNWPFDNPSRYEGKPGMKELFAAFENRTAHVFPYTAPLHIHDEHPLRKRLNDRVQWDSPRFQQLYVEQCRDLVEQYGVTGIYEDCSWVHQRQPHGRPDGDNFYSGSVRMRDMFGEALPKVALMGERNNEVTARGQHIALCWIPTANATRHPICGYLFNPFLQRWNLASGPGTYDDEDITGFTVTNWPLAFHAQPMQEDKMIRLRGLVFAREQLQSHWPEVWDPAVMHYFRGRDGTEYRFVRDRGTRFVKMNGNAMETVYWRLRGEREVAAPGVGIEGWIGYDGERIIGLNPHAPLYVTVEGAVRSPAVISGLPDGFALQRTVVREGYWVAKIDTYENLKTVPAPDAPEPQAAGSVQTVRVRADRSVQFTGVESARKTAENEYELRVVLPGGFGCYWDAAPAVVKVGHHLGSLPAKRSTHSRATGVVYEIADAGVQAGGFRVHPGTPPDQEGSITWLLTLPAEPVKLVFGYGTNHGYGDGANYMVRVNGRERWKAYRRQTSQDPEESKKHIAPPIEKAAVDLSDCAGQTIVIELGVNGHNSGGSETVNWESPRLEAVGKGAARQTEE